METPYEIPNPENQKNDVGTNQKPLFYHITSGKFIKKSAIFYAQIHQKYHEYHIRNVNSETLNLACVDRSCPARALLRVPKSSGLITVKRTKTKTNGTKQKIYQFNYGDRNARKLSNFMVIAKDSPPHSEHPVTKLGLLSGVKRDLRELHIEMGLKTHRPEVDAALSLMKIRDQIGVQNELRVLGRKHNELQAFYRKMKSQRSNHGNIL